MLNARQSKEIQEYLTNYEFNENCKIGFDLIDIMSGQKRSLNKKMVRTLDSKKTGQTNKPTITIKSGGMSGIQLIKKRTVFEVDEESTSSLMASPGRIAYSDSYSKNSRLKGKRMSMLKKGDSFMRQIVDGEGNSINLNEELDF